MYILYTCYNAEFMIHNVGKSNEHLQKIGSTQLLSVVSVYMYLT